MSGVCFALHFPKGWSREQTVEHSFLLSPVCSVKLIKAQENDKNFHDLIIHNLSLKSSFK